LLVALSSIAERTVLRIPHLVAEYEDGVDDAPDDRTDPAGEETDQQLRDAEAVVRRNEANDNAGFNLTYESTSGLKGGPSWYTVPDNKKWHTVTWKLGDAQFVNYWGFNFSLNSDGNKFNKYYIQSVTVTKLTK